MSQPEISPTADSVAGWSDRLISLVPPPGAALSAVCGVSAQPSGAVATDLVPPRRARRRCLRAIEHPCRAIPEGETIFVSVASYRDPQCPETVFDLFDKAAYPSRIFVGVCQHNEDIRRGCAGRIPQASRPPRGPGFQRPGPRVLGAGRSSPGLRTGALLDRATALPQRALLPDYRFSHPVHTPHWNEACIRMWN